MSESVDWVSESEQFLTNWAGQRIRVGDVVWRGARDGNSSTFKVGKVVALVPNKEDAYGYRTGDKAKVEYVHVSGGMVATSVGTASVQGLAVIDPATLREPYRKALEALQ